MKVESMMRGGLPCILSQRGCLARSALPERPKWSNLSARYRFIRGMSDNSTGAKMRQSWRVAGCAICPQPWLRSNLPLAVLIGYDSRSL